MQIHHASSPPRPHGGFRPTESRESELLARESESRYRHCLCLGSWLAGRWLEIFAAKRFVSEKFSHQGRPLLASSATELVAAIPSPPWYSADRKNYFPAAHDQTEETSFVHSRGPGGLLHARAILPLVEQNPSIQCVVFSPDDASPHLYKVFAPPGNI